MHNNFEISLVVFMPNITTNHAITYTKTLEISALIEDTIHCYLMIPSSIFFLSAFEKNVLEVYKYLKMKFWMI